MTLRGRKKGETIPQGVVARLPVYFRYLSELEAADIERVSSAQLGEALDFTAAQIRSDLSYFGSFGQQGYGYNVKDLLQQVKNILGLDRTYSMVLVGAGNLGKAIASYESFRTRGFEVTAIFDIDPLLIGNHHGGCVIRPYQELGHFLKKTPVDIGIIATPKRSSQEVCDLLVKSGVTSIWNFSPAHLVVDDHVIVEHMHLTDSLLRLAFRMNEQLMTRS